MAFPDIDQLNLRFGTPGRIAFRTHEGGFPVVSLVNRFGACEVSFYGGHVLSYRPTGHGPVLFLSRASLFELGKPIRGGVPICWPWFGPRPDDRSLPIHGFARVQAWTLVNTSYSSDTTELTLALRDSESTRGLWPFAFELTLNVRLDQYLRLTLTTENKDTKPFTITQGFHPYFRLRDLADATVVGLDQAAFTDRLTGQPGQQEGPLAIHGETDRLYAPPKNECAIRDAGLKRAIAVAFSGAKQLVVWNPWIDKARAMADFGDDEYTRMLCVEPVNAADGAVELAPGEKHALSMSIQATLT
jgi:D-hexose-6-phosphate mutarotase